MANLKTSQNQTRKQKGVYSVWSYGLIASMFDHMGIIFCGVLEAKLIIQY